MPKGTIKRLIADRGFGFIQQRKAKTCSSTVTNFKGWTTVPSEKGNKLNLRLDRGVMVVPRQSASSLHHNAI